MIIGTFKPKVLSLIKCSFLHILNILKNQLTDFKYFTYLKLRVLLRSERYPVAFDDFSSRETGKLTKSNSMFNCFF
jgi:hypothetical protein